MVRTANPKSGVQSTHRTPVFMTNDKVKQVCDELLALKCFEGITPDRDWCPSKRHLVWMLHQIKNNTADGWSEGKTGRWLGFVQGVLCFQGFTTIDLERIRNKE